MSNRGHSWVFITPIQNAPSTDRPPTRCASRKLVDIQDAELSRLEGVLRAYLTGEQSRNWVIANLMDIPIGGDEIREVLERLTQELESVTDKPVKKLANDLLAVLEKGPRPEHD